jgi:hypothetical protein
MSAPTIETLIAAHEAAIAEHNATFEDEGVDQDKLLHNIDATLIAIVAARPTDPTEAARRRAWLSANLVKETDACSGLMQRVYDALLAPTGESVAIMPLFERWRAERRTQALLARLANTDDTIQSIGRVMGGLEREIAATPARTLQEFAAKLIAQTCFGAYPLELEAPRGKAIIDEAADILGIGKEERQI